MLNQVVLVGKIKEYSKEQDYIILAVSRSYKNENGEYDQDFIKINLFSGFNQQLGECCKKGNIIGIKGRIEENNNNIIILAEKITFLSGKVDNDGTK